MYKRQHRGLAMSSPKLKSTSRRFSTSSADNDPDEQPPLYNRVVISSSAAAKNTKPPSSVARSDSDSDHRNSLAVSRPIGKEKAAPKSRSRPAKQKMKSPAVADEDGERQRAELDNAFEAACRLPSTVRGQPSHSTNRWSTFGSQKVSRA